MAAEITAEMAAQEKIEGAIQHRFLRESPAIPVGYEEEINNTTGTEHVFSSVEELETLCEGLGVYMVLPTKEMLKRAEDYYNANWDRINTELEPLLTPYLRGVVAEDYARILAGIYSYSARIPEMVEILKSVSTVQAYRIDTYGLYVTLLMGYSRALKVNREFNDIFRAPMDSNLKGIEQVERLYRIEEEKKNFINKKWSLTEAQAFNFIVSHGTVEVGDFVGLDLRDITKFLDNITTLSSAGDYLSYYSICKKCLGATREELEAIAPPPLFGSVFSSVTMAEEALQALENRLYMLGEKVDVVMSISDTEKRKQVLDALNHARTPEEQEGVIQNARQIAQEERDRAERAKEPTLFDEPEQGGEPQQDNAEQSEQNVIQVEENRTLTANTEATDIIRLPETFGLILSRDLYGGIGGKAKDILPITSFIRDYVENEGLDKNISAGVVEKAVEGLNLLQRFERVRPVNGLYTYHTNISKFAEACGYKDANEEEKKALLTALGVLNGLYLIVWTPKGREAVNVLRLRKIGLDGQAAGNLVLDISEEVMKGRPNLLTWGELQQVRDNCKGQAERHFRYQIYGKGHIEEEDMLKQVFGYDTMLLEATRGTGNEQEYAEQVKNVKRYISTHKAADRKKMRGWFEKFAKQGYISYTITTNKRGETVYKWKRLKAPQDIPVPYVSPQENMEGSNLDIQTPDEQGQ